MFGAIFAYVYAILLFGLSAEADTPFLEGAGVTAAVWMVISGSIVGWRAARRDD